MNEELEKVVECMEAYGGSFVKLLAQCFRHADHINFQKLMNAFPEYWQTYKEMSKK